MQQQQILAQLKTLTTENINPNSLNIDIVPTLEKLRLLIRKTKKVALAIEEELPANCYSS